MKLAQDEQILKSWNYSSIRQKGEKKEASLIVTNKRIVSDISGNRECSRHEIPIGSVKSISMKHAFPSKWAPILLIIFGIIMFIAVIVVQAMVIAGGAPIMWVALVPAVIFIVVGIILLSKNSFMLIITTSGVEGDALLIGVSNFLRRKRSGGKMKLKVNRDVVRDIYDSLGSIVFTYNK